MCTFVLRKLSVHSVRRRHSMFEAEKQHVPPEASNHPTEDAVALAVIKLTTLLITELKHGALVAAVHAKDVSTVRKLHLSIASQLIHSHRSATCSKTGR